MRKSRFNGAGLTKYILFVNLLSQQEAAMAKKKATKKKTAKKTTKKKAAKKR